MPRKKPPLRVPMQRSRNNPKRRLSAALPTVDDCVKLSNSVNYGCYSKHKKNPAAYKLPPYAGEDVERTYCDAHAKFGKRDLPRIPQILKRGVMLGLWSDQRDGGTPRLLWAIDDTGWIFELKSTNSAQFEYHGYPLMPQDAFARDILTRARQTAFIENELLVYQDQGVRDAIEEAERFYK